MPYFTVCLFFQSKDKKITPELDFPVVQFIMTFLKIFYIKGNIRFENLRPSFLYVMFIKHTCTCEYMYILTHKLYIAAAAPAKSLHSCPTLCDPIDSSQPGSPIHGILQARTPEWVAISFSNA